MDSTETVCAGYIKQIGKIQTIAQTHVRCAGVEKVLSVCASTYVRVSETLTGEVRLAGRETLELVTLTDSGICRESGWTDYTDRAEIDGITATSKVSAVGKVLDTDIVSVTDGNVTLASVIEITLYAEECTVLPVSPPQKDGVYTGDSRLTYSKLVTRVSGKAEVKSEEKVNLVKFICADARACLSGAEAALDAVIVTGDVMIDGLGLTSEGAAQPFSLVLPLSEELGAEGARRGDMVQMRVISTNVIVEESEDGLTVSATVELLGAVYSELTVSCAVDAFSPDCKLEIIKTPCEGVTVVGEKYFNEQAEGTVSLPEGENADKVLALCGFTLSPLSAYPENGRAVIEGAVSGCIVYADAEAGRKSSSEVEVPFKITTDVEAEDGWLLDVSGSVGKITVRPSRLGELNVKSELNLCLQTAKTTCAEIITNIVCGEKMPDRKGIISMHIAADGESLWESAKELCVTPETVLLQNPELDFPLKKGQKVFVFRTR